MRARFGNRQRGLIGSVRSVLTSNAQGLALLVLALGASSSLLSGCGNTKGPELNSGGAGNAGLGGNGPSGTAGGGPSQGVSGSNIGIAGGGGASEGGSPASGGAGGSDATGSAGLAGAAGVAGGTSFAGSAGSAGAAGASSGKCVTSGTELCDDFETGTIGPAWQQNKSGPVTITVDGVHTHSGKFAVHFHGADSQINRVTISEAVSFPAQNNSFYARIFAYFYPDLPSVPPTIGSGKGSYHMGFIVGNGNNSLGKVDAGMGLNGGARQYSAYSIFYGAPSFEFGPWSNTARAAANVWTCLELFENGSNPETETRQVWIDDMEVPEFRTDSAASAGTSHPNHKPPKFAQVTVGMFEFHESPHLTDMWVDDVRVSSQRIGCSK